jgi:hypothetical protein
MLDNSKGGTRVDLSFPLGSKRCDLQMGRGAASSSNQLPRVCARPNGLVMRAQLVAVCHCVETIMFSYVTVHPSLRVVSFVSVSACDFAGMADQGGYLGGDR